jgi:dTDP-4-amino-4,6-dideoxygalactose transaminase
MEKKILVTRSSMPELEEYIDEIREMWDTHWLTNMGVKHKKLESDLAEYLDIEKESIALFVNGHQALECIIEALGLGTEKNAWGETKNEVITTPFTFASTTNAIVRKGLKPVFCDIKEDDYTIDETKIEELITDKTCAIIPVHVYGNLCAVEEIQKIADKYKLKVIYDAAHAFAVTKDGVSSAKFGDASMFSFHATKVFNTIEGGAVCFRNSNLKKVLNDWKNFGITGPETVEFVGGNAKMNEFAAAMGICNLRHLCEEIEKRKKVHSRYVSNLQGIEGIVLNKTQNNVKSNYAYFPVMFNEKILGFTRDDVFERLKDNGVGARKYFYPLTSTYECYEGKFDVSETPTALKASFQVLTLPMYADLSYEDVDRICDIIKSLIK